MRVGFPAVQTFPLARAVLVAPRQSFDVAATRVAVPVLGLGQTSNGSGAFWLVVVAGTMGALGFFIGRAIGEEKGYQLGRKERGQFRWAGEE